MIQGPTLAVPPPVLGAPDTSVVLGGKKIDTGWRSGARVNLGCWLDCDHCYGTELVYFYLPDESKHHSVSSDGSPNSPFLLVPYYNVASGAEDSTAIASPLLQFAGTSKLRLANKMQGFEWNVLATQPSCDCGSRFIGLAGFRYWNFREHLTFTTNSPFISNAADIYKTKDKFSAGNNFYGGQIGLIWEYACGCLSITAKGKVALGAMRERLMIDGHLLTNEYNIYGDVETYSGGYFALPTNIGKHSRTKFAAIPEFNFDIGYTLCDCLRVTLGYTIIYVNNVLRAGNQIDRKINPSQATTYTNATPPSLVGEASPKARMNSDSLWVQGLKAGLELSF